MSVGRSRRPIHRDNAIAPVVPHARIPHRITAPRAHVNAGPGGRWRHTGGTFNTNPLTPSAALTAINRHHAGNHANQAR